MIRPEALATEADNRRRWDGRTRGRYEVWYVVASDPESRTGVWIRTTLEAPIAEEPYAQAWFAFFDAADPARTFALNRKFSIGQMQVSDAPFEVRLPWATLSHGAARGEIAGRGHTARWDLSWSPGERSLRYLPEAIYGMSWPPTLVLTPTPRARLAGAVVADGRTLSYAGATGAQSHVWGRKHAFAWSWHRCSGFAGRPEVVLEGLVVRVKRGPVVTPRLSMLCLWLGEERIELRGLADLLWRGKGRWRTGSLEVRGRGAGVEILAEYRCRPEDMVQAQYHDPDGESAWCANTEVADCTLTVRRGGREQVLHAAGAGQFEIAGRAPDPAIARGHEEVE